MTLNQVKFFFCVTKSKRDNLHNYFKFDVRLYFLRVAASPRPPGGASVPAERGP